MCSQSFCGSRSCCSLVQTVSFKAAAHQRKLATTYATTLLQACSWSVVMLKHVLSILLTHTRVCRLSMPAHRLQRQSCAVSPLVLAALPPCDCTVMHQVFVHGGNADGSRKWREQQVHKCRFCQRSQTPACMNARRGVGHAASAPRGAIMLETGRQASHVLSTGELPSEEGHVAFHWTQNVSFRSSFIAVGEL